MSYPAHRKPKLTISRENKRFATVEAKRWVVKTIAWLNFFKKVVLDYLKCCFFLVFCQFKYGYLGSLLVQK